MALGEFSWAFFGLLSGTLAAVMLLMQEWLKVEGFALAFWCKVSCAIVTLPFVIYYGLPTDPLFYAWLFPQAALFVIADVSLFRNLPVVGAGVISRLLPGTVVAGFFLWFAVAPSEIKLYLDNPVLSLMIISVLCAAAFFATRLRKCDVSMRAVKIMWFVLFANTVSPLLAKITTRYANTTQGAFGFTFAEALMMLAMWLVWLFVAKPVPISVLMAKDTLKKGLCIGVVTSTMVVVTVASLYFIDNPAYVCALQLIYAPIIIVVNKWMGKDDGSDIRSGLGIVACSAALIILKTQLN